jgi:hypothetical protein
MPESEEPSESTYAPERKTIFSSDDYSTALLAVAIKYYQNGEYNYAIASATLGLPNAPKRPDFTAILGCSVMKLGFFNEALFHLQNASDYQGLKSSCMQELKQKAQ